jgi:glycosyl transferase, family 25
LTAADQTKAGPDLVRAVGPVVVINLRYRTDRLREVTAELARIGLRPDGTSLHRFDAIRPTESAGFATVGARGCFLSHLGVLERAVEAAWPGVVIVEDDMDFVRGIDRRLRLVLHRLNGVDWGVFHGGTSHAVPGEVIDEALGLQTAWPGAPILLAHFVAFRGPAQARARDYLRAILTRRPGDPAGGAMDVDGAYNHFRADNPDILAILANPPIAVQRPSFADVRDRKWFDQVGIFKPALQIARRIKRELRRRV